MSSNDWVLVTGAAKRIGRTIALNLAAAGWNVVVHYNSSVAEATSLADEIRALGREVFLAPLDLMNLQAVQTFIQQLKQHIGIIQALVNNASLFEPDTCDPDGSRHRVTNVTAPGLLSEQFFAARNPQSKRLPVIVNLLDADPSHPGFNSYNASRRDAAQLTAELAVRFLPHVRVNGVALGPVLPSPRESQQHFDALLQSTPLRRPIAPRTIAATVHFLIDNPSLTGVIIPVDNGAHLKK